MRRIRKNPTPPQCLQDFISRQQGMDPPVVNLTYEDFHNPGRRDLRKHLIAEQFGLCGYTGAPVDERMSQMPSGTDATFGVTTEHLKPQSVCREEIEARGVEFGTVLGEDLDYNNMIAVMKVGGSKRELFGEAVRGDVDLPVWPTHEDCEERFDFDDRGKIRGRDEGAKETVKVLKLDHETLRDWRQAAVQVFLSPEVIQTQEDLRELVEKLQSPPQGSRLPEFAFVIKNVAERLYLS